MILRKSLPALWLTGGISAVTILSAAPAKANVATLFEPPPGYTAIPGGASDYSPPSWNETLPWTWDDKGWDDKKKELTPGISIVSVWNTAIGGPTNALGPGASAQGGSTGTFDENGSQGGSTGAFWLSNAQGGPTGSSGAATAPFAPDDARSGGTTGSFAPGSIISNAATGPIAPDGSIGGGTGNGTTRGLWPQDAQNETAATDVGSYDPVHEFFHNLFSFFSLIGSLGLQSLQSSSPADVAGNG
ncbi:hypothetical protein [Frankia sp. R82]|uniref:hypothetical protein n=1 Tax=Frankia sp. R82 TaxID=2950553 RepID=UPI0020436544|nr:hypothetical protein [Frankia sp. R82]MCM3887174.1 hypothetical protein [Frankia sp. R82]